MAAAGAATHGQRLPHAATKPMPQHNVMYIPPTPALAAWEREEWALSAVNAVVRLRSPRCSRCRHCVMLLTCSGGGVGRGEGTCSTHACMTS